MTANPSAKRIYLFGLFIEKTVFFVVIFGISILVLGQTLHLGIPNASTLLIISGAVAIYTLLYHQFVYAHNPTTLVAFIDSLVYSFFIFLINHATGGLDSPLFFLYLLPIISVRLNLGSKLPLAITFFVVSLNILEFLISSPLNTGSMNQFYASIHPTDFYQVATRIISILLVGLYIRSVSIELTTEHAELSEIEKLNQELRRLNSGKDEFISIASHEIRTPLTAIRGGLELLKNNGVGNLTVEQSSFVQRLLSAANRLGQVAEDTLNIAALEKHRFTLKVAPFNIQDIIDQTLTNYTDEALGKKISLKKEIPDKLPKVIADEQRIGIVLTNLVSNAIKFTPSGGKISVSAQTTGSKVLISIRDSGVGIPKEEQRNLFRKFYRVQNVMSETSQGTGLGLYIVRLILDLHGETVGVESEPGKGSVFHFTLKAAND